MPDENDQQNKAPGMFGIIRQKAQQEGKSVENISVKDEIGTTAGDVYRFLDGKGEVPLGALRAAMESKGPLFAASLGWLLKEDKIDMAVTPAGIRVKLKAGP